MAATPATACAIRRTRLTRAIGTLLVVTGATRKSSGVHGECPFSPSPSVPSRLRAPRFQRALLLLHDLLAGLQGPRSGLRLFQGFGQLLDLLGEPPGRGLLGRIDRLELPRRRVELRVLGLQLAPLFLRRLLVFL